MTGPPAARPFTESAPSVNRAQQTVMVRFHNGDLGRACFRGLCRETCSLGSGAACRQNEVALHPAQARHWLFQNHVKAGRSSRRSGGSMETTRSDAA